MIDSCKTLFTFDIDGTILNCLDGKEVRLNAFLSAYQKFFNTNKFLSKKDLFGKLTIGMTDAATAQSILNKHQGHSSPKEIYDFLQFYNESFIHSNMNKPVLTNGIREIVNEIKKCKNTFVCLASGATFETAKYRISYVEVSDLFVPFIGGFGDNLKRKDCIREAIREAHNYTRSNISCVIHIGDTNDDIESALKVNAIPIGVKTGMIRYKQDQYSNYFFNDLIQAKDKIMSIIASNSCK